MHISIRQWQENFLAGRYRAGNLSTQTEAGWHDWFCSDAALARKTERMGKIISQIKDGGKVDLDTTYVWFKNNCPLVGKLYDDFRIADIETGKTVMTICIRQGYTVYCQGHWREPIREFARSPQLVKWLNEARSEINEGGTAHV